MHILHKLTKVKESDFGSKRIELSQPSLKDLTLVKQGLASMSTKLQSWLKSRKNDFWLQSKEFDFGQPKEGQEKVGLGQQEQVMLHYGNKIKRNKGKKVCWIKILFS